jgi:glycosyltransferase involved in cell wall biosynthesis
MLVYMDSTLDSATVPGYLNIPIRLSHSPKKVFEVVAGSRQYWPNELYILPNNSACAYEATALLRRYFLQLGIIVKVIGIIHSNVSSSLDLVVENQCHLDICFGVTAAIQASVSPRLRGNLFCKKLSYPVEQELMWATISHSRNYRSVFRIIYVGRLVNDQKCFSRVLDLIRLLRGAKCKFLFEVIGDGPLRDELETLGSLSSDPNPDLVIRGAIPHVDVISALSRAHVIVLTSDFEGSPLALMEAMSVGAVPVVMNYGEEVSELITHTVDGYVVPAADTEQMIAALVNLDRDRVALERMSFKAASRAKGFSTFESWKREICNVPQISDGQNEHGLGSYTRIAMRIKRGLPPLKQTTRILIYGGGHIGRMIIDELCARGNLLIGSVVVDRVLSELVVSYRNVPYRHLKTLKNYTFDLAIIASDYYSKEILLSILKWSRDHCQQFEITGMHEWRGYE